MYSTAVNSTEVVRVPLPTPEGLFQIRAFETTSGVYIAMVLGDIEDQPDVMVRLHSECLTGDALGSLRCDCGVQLRLGLRLIAANGSGALIYATGQEGRGIGLVNKLQAYVAQDAGADTVDANLRLGLPVDSREYTDAAAVLTELGVRSIRLLTNNPRKVEELRAAGIEISEVVPIATAPHLRNLTYLTTKQERMDHVRPTGSVLSESPGLAAVDATDLIGMATAVDRPHVVVKSAQTVDGRIATSGGDSKWITGPEERRVTHALRAACDAVLVGIGTVLADDPLLTVRDVPGASPLRVILDSNLRIPLDANVLGDAASTLIFTSEDSDPKLRGELRERGIGVEVVDEVDGSLSIEAMLDVLFRKGVRSLLVEGGSQVITSFLRSRFVDRLIVSIAPTIIGNGTEAVADLGTATIDEGIHLTNRALVTVGDDLILAWDVEAASQESGRSQPTEIAV